MPYLPICALVIAQGAFAQTSGLSYQPNWRPYVNAFSQRDSDIAWSINYSRSLGNLSPARFLSIDRLAEKFPAFSPYTYSANNPVLFVDPTGDSVNVASIQQYDNNNKTGYLNSIVGDLAGQTGLTLSTSSSGQLVFAVDAKGNPVIASDANGNQVGSADARALLISAISSEQQAYATMTSGRSSVPAPGSPLIRLNPNQITEQIAGASGVNPATLGWGMTFMHEVLHSNVGGGLADPKTASFGATGQVVDRMNAIRAQLGSDYGQRLSYSALPMGGYSYLPFAPIAKMMLDQNRIPSTYYVRMKAR